uniref:cGMP-dependent protein kinase interacting domain-containing protein n=1 Tax=Seriola lalandi dorsalis TaxID=1841481 RepID=A0A3B4Y8V7_SERLL
MLTETASLSQLASNIRVILIYLLCQTIKFVCVSSCVCVRSYLTPVRDEESESQRKARSRQARQSRRSTQLYEQILAENEKLKAQLRDTDLELADLKLQLEKATQRQERYADRSQLEMEKRERRALERKISEMEEELKMLPDLKADNQRLKDENGALIRVISKLSK